MILIEKGYDIKLCKLNSYPETWSISVSNNQYCIEQIIKIDISHEEEVIAIIKTVIDEIKERVKE